MPEITAFSERDIATRERLEDYAADVVITTAGGLKLQLALVCDGAGGGDAGEKAARLTARAIMDHLQVSTGQSIPKLLVSAVEQANRVVYSELRGTGTTTLAMVVINLSDGSPHGRMFIASVGNSRVYLLRDGRSVRLNIDHTLGNEYIFAGQMSPEEAEKLSNADFITRAIGVNAEVQVDIGFYAERGREFVSSRRAFRLGQKGLELKEGDSVIVTSDGLFNVEVNGGRPYAVEQEFVRYALDDKVDHAGQAIMSYAAAYNPQDNTAISLVFVPSPRRRAVIISSLSRRQRTGLSLSLLVVIIILLFFLFLLRQSEQRNDTLLATQTEFQLIVYGLSATAPPTFTPTPSPSPSPTFTPTLRPTTVAENQSGIQYFLSSQAVPIFAGGVIVSAEDSQMVIEGPRLPSDTRLINPLNLFVAGGTLLELTGIDNAAGSENASAAIYPAGDMFANIGDFQTDGLSVQPVQNRDLQLFSRSECLAVRQIPANPEVTDDQEKVAFTCYSNTPDMCSFTLPGEAETAVAPGSRVLLELNTQPRFLESVPAPYEEARHYYDFVLRFTAGDTTLLQCLSPYLDIDGDTVPYPQDVCENEAGLPEMLGCPDTDGDGVIDTTDLCPQAAGPIESGGCPPPTATPLPDIDGDGLAGDADLCPLEAGPPETQGCPIPPTASQRPSPTRTATLALDRDGDGILDTVDQCPSEAGTLRNEGCPDGSATPQTPTRTNTNEPTQQSTATRTPSTEPTVVFSPTRTPTDADTPSLTPSRTPTDQETPSHTPTRTPTDAETPSLTPSNTATEDISPTPTRTFTSAPPTWTYTPSDTPVPPTPTYTPSNTLTPSETFLPTDVQVDTATPTSTFTPSNTPTYTPTVTGTLSDTPTSTSTFTPTATYTPTPTSTYTASNTLTPSNTPTPTASDTPTPSDTPTFTPTVTGTLSETPTVDPSATETSTPVDTSVVLPIEDPPFVFAKPFIALDMREWMEYGQTVRRLFRS